MSVSEASSGPASSRRVTAFRCPEPNVRDPRNDDELINQFPLLIPQTEDEELRRVFVGQYSILMGELIRFRELLRKMAAARRQSRRAAKSREFDREALFRGVHDYYAQSYGLKRENLDRDMRMLSDGIVSARDTIAFILKEYFPRRMHRRLEMTTEVASSHDPIELILECAVQGMDIQSRTRRFEARRQLTFAQIEFELQLNGAGRQDLMRDVGWFADVCDDGYFVKKESEQRTVIALLNAEDENRVKKFQIHLSRDPVSRTPSSPNEYVVPLNVRFIPSSAGPIPVYLETRIKEHIPIKLIKKRQRRHETLTDLCGAKFVFFDEGRELMAGVERIRRTIARAPGCVSGEASNIARAGQVDPKNVHSSEEYRARKWDVRLNNRHFELQFMYLPYYLNEQVSHGKDNHPLYKLSQYLDLVFPVLFPSDLYGLDWHSQVLREELWNYQLTRI
jgi:hypothetical protein